MNFSEMQILWVDDEPLFIEAFMDEFRRNGFVVHAASNIEQALDILKQYPISAIIIDAILPSTTLMYAIWFQRYLLTKRLIDGLGIAKMGMGIPLAWMIRDDKIVFAKNSAGNRMPIIICSVLSEFDLDLWDLQDSKTMYVSKLHVDKDTWDSVALFIKQNLEATMGSK